METKQKTESELLGEFVKDTTVAIFGLNGGAIVGNVKGRVACEYEFKYGKENGSWIEISQSRSGAIKITDNWIHYDYGGGSDPKFFV